MYSNEELTMVNKFLKSLEGIPATVIDIIKNGKIFTFIFTDGSRVTKERASSEKK